ncbi:amino-acid N-acetyltransferase [Gynuella sp.]|uniref:amino-acid N-acetyltransferase n=1 Tax=Gynuella sp. TaxID=2969146 RepID=UPI003D10E129
MNFVDFFRSTAPYIHAHRTKTLVVGISGEGLDQPAARSLVPDLALLNSLGMRVVLVYGARSQINRRLQEKNITSVMHSHMRVTSPEIMETILDVHGQLRSQLEAQFSLGMVNSPMHNAKVRCVSGNFVLARPVGVIDGVDMQHTGVVRKVDASSIRQLLDNNFIVLMSHLGYSPTGELFNVSVHDVAVQTAVALKADKLVIVGDCSLVLKEAETITELFPSQCQRILDQHTPEIPGYAELEAMVTACRAGVGRCHLLPFDNDGSILNELYTRDGIGTLVTQEAYDSIRPATINDVAGILELLLPLEIKGVLVRRSRELLEQEINHFMVNERDGMIIGCAALYPFLEDEEKTGELACVAVHEGYRHEHRGDRLMRAITERAHALGLSSLFVLTTHTAHWFLERGFQQIDVDGLPMKRKSLYNYQRNSKVFKKNIGPLRP